jgi:hypothetical protein
LAGYPALTSAAHQIRFKLVAFKTTGPLVGGPSHTPLVGERCELIHHIWGGKDFFKKIYANVILSKK